MEKKSAQQLYEDYLAGRCTPEEKAVVERAFTQIQRTNTEPYTEEQHAQWARQSLEQILGKKRFRILPLYKYAAAILVLALAIGLYLYKVNQHPADIKPGYNQATLTLADGKTISLDSAQSGIIIGDGNIKYQNGNNVLAEKGEGPGASGTYNPDKSGQAVERTTYNSLSTPKCGQYQVILQDGTKVWLNAASTLKYPSRFSGDTRVVEISGEAFFEVAQQKDNPFRVKSKGQLIDVLGTSFNVSAYEADVAIKTTLVTGAVQVSNDGGRSALTLAPGEQSLAQLNGNITKATVNIAREIAWKNNEFRFSNESLSSAMQQIARWYDIQVTFADPSLQQATVTGIIGRQENLSAILQLFEDATNLQYYITGRQLTIKKK